MGVARSMCASQIESWYRFAVGLESRRTSLFGIIARAVRLRNSVGTAAVKSPDPMRDVAQFGCDQSRVMNVDDLVGT